MGMLNDLGTTTNRHLFSLLILPLILLPGLQAALFYSDGSFLELPMLSVLLRAAIWGISLFVLTAPFWLMAADPGTKGQDSEQIMFVIVTFVTASCNAIYSTILLSFLYVSGIHWSHRTFWIVQATLCVGTALIVLISEYYSKKVSTGLRASRK